MKDYQRRVFDEEQQLNINVTAFKAFIADSPVFKEESPEEQLRMKDQVAAMGEYLAILQERIANFTE